MIRHLLLLLTLSFGLTLSAQEGWNPLADESAVVVSGNARFTVLTPQMIRIQYSQKQLFEDRATFAVVNRRLPVPSFTQDVEDGYLVIRTEALTLRYKIGSVIKDGQTNSSNLGITFHLNGKPVTWYPGKDDALNLMGTYRTLDGNIGDTHRVFLEKGLLSRAGWAILDESPSARRGDGSQSFPFDTPVDGIPWVGKVLDASAVDWYFMGYGHDYPQAQQDYVLIAGRQPLPPRYMFGYWYSKYQAYSSAEFQQLVRDMESNSVPHDVMMFDCDWHQNSWTGWTWNKSLIPSPRTLLNWMHTHHQKVALNLHPADGIGSSDDNFSLMRAEMGLPSTATTIPWQIEDSTFYRTFTRNILRVREDDGVDFWWLDWQQALTSSYVKGLGQTFWLNHVFYNDMRLHRPDRRPVIFHRWGGMGSHRYPLGFSGDAYATFGTLQFQSYYTATAANACFGYWGHDGGGYLEPTAGVRTNPELMLRWMQFCVFTPIFRTHGSSQGETERRIWKFANFQLQNQAFQLRYTLVPYIYTCARQAYDTGMSICRPLYYEWPEENRAYSIEDEYLFGSQILVSPISRPADADDTTPRTTWLPAGLWYDACRNTLRQGDAELQDRYSLGEIPYFVKAGSIIPCQPGVSDLKSEAGELQLWVVPGADEGQFRLYEDQGDSEAYRQGQYATTLIRQQRADGYVCLMVEGRQGAYEGMPQSRRLTARFFLQAKPTQVLVDGQTCTTWQYDEPLRQLTVSLPERNCDAPTLIELYSEPDAVDAVAASSLDIRFSNDARQLDVRAQAGGAVQLSVVDMLGREVLHASGSLPLSVSTRSLPAGQYICRALGPGSTGTLKFIQY